MNQNFNILFESDFGEDWVIFLIENNSSSESFVIIQMLAGVGCAL